MSAVNETTSIFTLINATTDSAVSAAYSDGSALLGEVSAGGSDSALLEPSELGITVAVTDGTSQQNLNLPGGLYGGVSYGAVAVSDGESVQFLELPDADRERLLGWLAARNRLASS